MRDHLSCFIDGTWQNPDEPNVIDVINPATETPFGRIALGGSSDVDRAVAAARAAFEAWSATTPDERADLLESIIAAYEQRVDELAATITEEMGAPARLSKAAQATAGLAHLHTTLAAMRDFPFEERRGTTLIRHVPVGVCGLITPWNWSTNQVMCKVAPALAAGCTMVLKPSEFTPFSAIIQAEILEAAGVPAGVFNMVMGDGPTVGAAISSHPGLDMVSFTGSTAAGAAVARAAADTIKRVSQELGGKSPNIVLPDADLAAAVTRGVRSVMTNSGQSCNAPTRMLVPADRHDEACELAANAAARLVVGDPTDGATTTGPVANGRQWQRVQDLIRSGIDEGAALVCGGPGRPDGLDTGWYVRPTVFGGVDNAMRIAREEVFGPVLTILPYSSEDEAVSIANDTDYGLAAYVQSDDPAHAAAVGLRLRAGQVSLNGVGPDFGAPFGGFKRSGNGREWGREGMEEYLEVMALIGME